MRPRKARPGDERLIHDEAQDWAERGSALSRLAADGRLDLEPVARDWLHGDDPELAVEALGQLLTYWRTSPRVHEYVKTGIGWLETRDNPWVRNATITCLATFMKLSSDMKLVPDHRDEILSALLRTLERDEDPVVQEDCYSVLLKELGMPAEIENIPHYSVRDFDRATDVRWDLLAPLRERYSKN
jgi:hypothetical protein